MCSCAEAWPVATKEEALRWAHGHGTSVSAEIERVEGEGGDGWLCLFCGEVVGKAPLRVMVHWTDEGVNDAAVVCGASQVLPSAHVEG